METENVILTKEFDQEKFEKDMGLIAVKEPYDYEYHRGLNPKLSQEMYDYCYNNGNAWKIRCGKKVIRNFGIEILEHEWFLDTDDNNRNICKRWWD
jgi:hypothetical protein